MNFGTIIEAAGFNPCQFPHSSSILVTLYDGKDRLQEETVQFNKELFADNTKSAVDFFNFINFLEQKFVSSFSVKIDETSVIVFYGTKQSICFKRTPALDLFDYMA